MQRRWVDNGTQAGLQQTPYWLSMSLFSLRNLGTSTLYTVHKACSYHGFIPSFLFLFWGEVVGVYINDVGWSLPCREGNGALIIQQGIR